MIDFIASLFYPKKCVRCRARGGYICADCFASISFLQYQLCAVCQKGSIDGLVHPKCISRYGIDGILSSIAYKGIVKKLIYQFKYPPYLSDLKTILGKLLYEGMIQQESFTKFTEMENVWVTCVPLHPKRQRGRGYNQSELLGQDLSTRLGAIYMKELLIRVRNTKPQFELKKDQRGANIVGAFKVNPKFINKLSKINIILVDDIATSGATLRECGKVLKKGGAGKVLGVTLAHEG